MKVQIKAEINAHEIIESFLKQLKDNNIQAEPGDIKILVLSKDGKEVDITPDRLRVAFEKS